MGSFLDSLNKKRISTTFLPDGWEGTIVDILESADIPFREKLRLIGVNNLISAKITKQLVHWFLVSFQKWSPSPLLAEIIYDYQMNSTEEEMFLKVVKIKENNPKLVWAGLLELVLLQSKTDIFLKIHELTGNHLMDYLGEKTAEGKILWKIKDLVLTNLIDGNVDFIIQNKH